jgi:hypothetical protein
MSMNKTQVDSGANFIRTANPGECVMEQTQPTNITTVGAGTVTAAGMATGYIERTGPVGGYSDTLDTADNLIAAIPNAGPGDSFEFTMRNTVAFLQTLVVAEGAELFGAFTTVAASSVRKFLITVLANARRQSFLMNMTNTQPTLTGLTQAQAQLLVANMGVSAASGITGGTTVLGVNTVTGVVTLSANATATQSIAVTFFPRYNIRGLFQASL